MNVTWKMGYQSKFWQNSEEDWPGGAFESLGTWNPICDWNTSWTYVQFWWPGLLSDMLRELSLQACIQLGLFLCPVLNYKSFEMLQPNLNDLFLGVKTTFPMNGTFNFCQKLTYKGQIPDFLAKSGPFPDQFWNFSGLSIIIFINLSTIIFQSSLTGKFIWGD